MFKPDPQIKKTGSKMIIFGWLLTFIMVAFFFNNVINHQANPNTIKVLSGQGDTLVLKSNYQGLYLAEGKINEINTEFIVDTGASIVSVPLFVANAANMPLGGRLQVNTANGVASAWASSIDYLQIGNFIFEDISAVVLDNDMGDAVLLGMNAIRNLSIKQEAGVLELSIVN